MMITMTQGEIVEAIQEWCERRAIPLPGDPDISLLTRYVGGAKSESPTSDTHTFSAQIRNVQLTPQFGPYR